MVTSYPKERISEYVLGVDWGFEHPLALSLIGIDYDDNYWIIDEIYTKHQLIDKSLVDLMKQKGWFDIEYGNGITRPKYAYADSARPEAGAA